MDDDDYELLLGKIVGLDLLMRGLYAKWAVEAPDPIASNNRKLDAMIISIREIDPPSSEGADRIYKRAEDFLRDFQKNVETRLIGQGHQA